MDLIYIALGSFLLLLIVGLALASDRLISVNKQEGKQ